MDDELREGPISDPYFFFQSGDDFVDELQAGELVHRYRCLIGGGEPFGASSAGSQLIRERATVMGATSRVDDVIGQAQATARELVSQRGILGAASGALGEFGARFGTINNLLVAIKRKRSKDTIVLSGVVAVCTAFTLIYWLAK